MNCICHEILAFITAIPSRKAAFSYSLILVIPWLQKMFIIPVRFRGDDHYPSRG